MSRLVPEWTRSQKKRALLLFENLKNSELTYSAPRACDLFNLAHACVENIVRGDVNDNAEKVKKLLIRLERTTTQRFWPFDEESVQKSDDQRQVSKEALIKHYDECFDEMTKWLVGDLTIKSFTTRYCGVTCDGFCNVQTSVLPEWRCVGVIDRTVPCITKRFEEERLFKRKVIDYVCIQFSCYSLIFVVYLLMFVDIRCTPLPQQRTNFYLRQGLEKLDVVHVGGGLMLLTDALIELIWEVRKYVEADEDKRDVILNKIVKTSIWYAWPGITYAFFQPWSAIQLKRPHDKPFHAVRACLMRGESYFQHSKSLK